ncbi:MAG: DUF547 domain-containing protein [Natrialbaceae archaeon]
MPPEFLEAAESFLLAVGREEDLSPFRERLAEVGENRLSEVLSTRDSTTAFWLDVYNAVVGRCSGTIPRCWNRVGIVRPVFRRPLVTVTGQDLGLDDVEHGLLRGSKLGWGQGYLPDPFPDAFERRFRVSSVDPRVHFALNPGAASCPPIAVYRAGEVDGQLDLASEASLETESDYDPESNVVRAPRLVFRYRGDFGGGRGTREFLRRYDVIPEGASPRVRYRSCDWSLELGRFRESGF